MPLAVVIIAFAVANRQIVTVSLDPFSGDEPAASVTLPLFALVIVLLIVGVLIGGCRRGCGRASGAAPRGAWSASCTNCAASSLRSKAAAGQSSAVRRTPAPRPSACGCGRRVR